MSGQLPVEKLDVTIEFNAISDEIWSLVKSWPPFERETVGKQLVTSIDSIAANIVEGGHRESDLEAIRHFVIARASGEEASNWLRRVAARAIEPEAKLLPLIDRIRLGLAKLEKLISYRRTRLSKRKPS